MPSAGFVNVFDVLLPWLVEPTTVPVCPGVGVGLGLAVGDGVGLGLDVAVGLGFSAVGLGRAGSVARGRRVDPDTTRCEAFFVLPCAPGDPCNRCASATPPVPKPPRMTPPATNVVTRRRRDLFTRRRDDAVAVVGRGEAVSAPAQVNANLSSADKEAGDHQVNGSIAPFSGESMLSVEMVCCDGDKEGTAERREVF